MKYEKLEQYVSEPRLGKYLIACNHSKSQAQRLYTYNLRISQSYYPILNLFEIFIRNSINDTLSIHFHDQNWIKNQRTRFMDNTALARSGYYLKSCINKSIRKFGTGASSGKIISEQSFGFWTSLFLPHHYGLLQGRVIDCFPNKPHGINRSAIYVRLKAINDFRNRIYHNEPVCFLDNVISFQNAKIIHAYIEELIQWMDSDLLIYLNKFDNVQNKIINAESIFIP